MKSQTARVRVRLAQQFKDVTQKDYSYEIEQGLLHEIKEGGLKETHDRSFRVLNMESRTDCTYKTYQGDYGGKNVLILYDETHGEIVGFLRPSERKKE